MGRLLLSYLRPFLSLSCSLCVEYALKRRLQDINSSGRCHSSMLLQLCQHLMFEDTLTRWRKSSSFEAFISAQVPVWMQAWQIATDAILLGSIAAAVALPSG